MIAADEDALICDFAETYHIYDYRSLPVPYAAKLACGLPPDSRIMMAISGAKIPMVSMLLAAAVDRLSLLLWAQTKAAASGQNRPKSLLDALTKDDDNPVTAFSSGEEFDREWARLTGKEDVNGR